MNDIRKVLGKKRLYFDGGMGTLLSAKGLKAGECPEQWNITHPDIVCGIHESYIDAGADILKTNSFGINTLKYDDVSELIIKSIENAREAASKTEREVFIAYDIGPLGKLLKPFGDLDFEKAVSVFADGIKIAAPLADLILIETMTDIRETKAAVLAAKENSDLPVFVTNAYGLDGKLICGADPLTTVTMLESLGVDAIGVNCSFGPYEMLDTAKKLYEASSLPIIVNPNAGMPKSENGNTRYDVTPTQFGKIMKKIAEYGSVLGGCCGTTPDYIKETCLSTRDIDLPEITEKTITAVSSFSKTVVIGRGSRPVLIGERINPTGKPKLRQALRENDIDFISGLAAKQDEDGCDILDINVGLPEINEPALMSEAVEAVQSVTSLPVQIDSSDPSALEKGLRLCIGKPLINSVNGKRESLDTVLPLAKKYGGVLIALTLDENGIPGNAEGRLAIAAKIVSEAEKIGISRKNIIVDPLAMTVSTDPYSAKITLDSVRLIKNALGVPTSLGVSNISFGLPSRDIINAGFLTSAFEYGLDCAIMNPASQEMKKSYYSYLALHGFDESFGDYISFSNSLQPVAAVQTEETDALKRAITKGLTAEAVNEAEKRVTNGTNPLDLIEKDVISALNEVGRLYAEGKYFLPQLMISAETAKAVCDTAKKHTSSQSGKNEPVVLATVEGDIHDIGKNIVRTLLDNYGFNVIDLGKNVPPQAILDAAKSSGAKLVGLSALMTTTVPAMEKTISLFRKKLPDVRIAVGGAVLNESYANQIGADRYCAEAMDTVRYAEEIYRK